MIIMRVPTSWGLVEISWDNTYNSYSAMSGV